MPYDKCKACKTELPPPLRTPIKLEDVKIKFVMQTCPNCKAEFYSSIKEDT